ncbi:general stress protein [Alkalibacterium sp. f15]|uniref:general stress protein n=1 Tax=Alkalibacterium sp. f15 TaxID=3414029 RepID=UPI003BF78896
MNDQNKKVVGSYPDERETKRVIRDLMSQGFRKHQLTVYSNEEKHTHHSEVANVQVAQTDFNDKKKAAEDDKNFWESIRDAFKVREDQEFEDPDYVAEDDLLYPHREDLKNGRYVVVVDESNGQTVAAETASDRTVDPDTDKPSGTLGTTAGFPEEGSVQGMGDGGQPTADSRSSDGTPPELEDTAGTADERNATDERLRQSRKEDL